jgi:hypothetical protein
VLLYLLLMQQRYDLPHVPVGLLWNTTSGAPRGGGGGGGSAEGGAMALVPWRQGEVAALLSQRNRLAAALAGDLPRPPPMLQVRGEGLQGT